MSLPDGSKVIAFDFDGVLHDYHGWNGGQLNGPIPGMLHVVTRLREAGAQVVVHTTRTPVEVTDWLLAHGFPSLDVYNTKWSRIDVFVDDRAWQFHPHQLTNPHFVEDILAFEPHWRRQE